MKTEDMLQGLREVQDTIDGAASGCQKAAWELREMVYQVIAQADISTVIFVAMALQDRALDYVERIAESN